MTIAAQVPSVSAQPLIAVRDVRASSRWYSELLGMSGSPEHSHRDFYDRLFSSGQMVLQLHAWDEENHPNLVDRTAAPPGHGVLLWFMVEDFHAAVGRARNLGAEVVEDAHVNPAPNQWEIWLRDPDGYVVVIAGPTGGGGEPWHGSGRWGDAETLDTPYIRQTRIRNGAINTERGTPPAWKP